MSQDDPHRTDAPAPIRRPEQPADPSAPVANPVAVPQREPDRVVPSGFSRGEDAFQHDLVSAQQAWAAQVASQQQGAPYGAPGAWQQPPAAPSRARVPAALPLEGQVYAQALRPLTKRVGRWFLAWAIAIGFFFLGQAIALALMMPGVIELFSDLGPAASDPAYVMDTLMGSPMAFLGVNLSWAAMIPGAVVALAAYGDKAMGFAFSVAGRWRWRAVGRTAMVVAPIFAIYVAITFLIDPTFEFRFQPDWLLVAIVLLTTPLQSSGEEFAFRGIVTQQLGSWMRNPWVSSLVTGGAIGLVFGLAHVGYPPLAILQVSLVGFTCAMLTFRTGGLEAACVVHTANNVFIMLPLALMGMSPFATSSGEQGPFWIQLVAFLACITALGLSYLAVHLMSKGWQRRTEGAPGAEALLLPKQPAFALAGVAPGYGAPAYGAPAYGAPGYGMPQQAAPGYGAPGYGMPQQAAPGYGAPGYGMPQQGWPQQPAQPGWQQPGAAPQPGQQAWPPAAPQQWGQPQQPAPWGAPQQATPGEQQHAPQQQPVQEQQPERSWQPPAT